MRARSTAASVCPARTSTPPVARAQRKHVTGPREVVRAASSGRSPPAPCAARSAAEMPVLVLPCASIDTQNAVSNARCSWRPRAGSRARRAARGVIARQIRPRPCVAMKLIALGRHLLGGHREVALVLAILVVDDDDHAAGADGVDRLLDRGERRRLACARLRDPQVEACFEGDAPGRRDSSWQSAGTVGRRASAAARTTYLPSMSHSRFTRSPGRRAAQVRVRPGERDDLHVEASSAPSRRPSG